MKPQRHGTSRFYVQINENEYALRLIKNNEDAKLYRLRKQDGTIYIVGINNQGYTCNCPDNLSRHPEGGCKHIKALIANGVLP